MQRVLSTVILLGLLLASAAAFAITEHLKLIKSPIYGTDVTKEFSPVCRCATSNAVIKFKLRRADSLTVTIADSAGHVVDTLATDRRERAGAVTFRWDGRTDDGTASDGSVYQPRIKFANGRTIVMPNKILVDTTAPKVVSATDGDGLLIAGRHPVKLDYEFDGRARAYVYFGRHLVVRGRYTRSHGVVNWNGKVDGNALLPGRYRLEVAAVDIAGNETPRAERKTVFVRIRAIVINAGEASIHAAAGKRFTVDVRTGAETYAWRFAGKHGSGTTSRLVLQAPSKAGRYRLVVSEHGHSTSTLVIVGKR